MHDLKGSGIGKRGIELDDHGPFYRPQGISHDCNQRIIFTLYDNEGPTVNRMLTPQPILRLGAYLVEIPGSY
jgi:hypothetical protein